MCIRDRVKNIDLGSDDFLVYPNPFTDFLNIQLPVISEGQLNISVFNITGKEIYRTRIENLSPSVHLNIPARQLPGGPLILQIANTDFTLRKRIVKQQQR